jgi:hypothetical protein
VLDFGLAKAYHRCQHLGDCLPPEKPAPCGSWRGRSPQGATHLAVNLPADHRLARVGGASVELALSPDGNLLAFTAERAGESRLFLRARDQPEATPLPGTEGGHAPFFSPDGERFLMMTKPVVRTVNVVLNWFDELKAKMGEAEK